MFQTKGLISFRAVGPLYLVFASCMFRWSQLSDAQKFPISFLCFQFAFFFPFGFSQSSSGKAPGSDLLPVSPRQRKLLGIEESDPYFGPITSKPDPKPSSDHPFGFAAPLNGSFVASSTPSRTVAHQVWGLTLFFSLSPTKPSVSPRQGTWLIEGTEFFWVQQVDPSALA